MPGQIRGVAQSWPNGNDWDASHVGLNEVQGVASRYGASVEVCSVVSISLLQFLVRQKSAKDVPQVFVVGPINLSGKSIGGLHKMLVTAKRAPVFQALGHIDNLRSFTIPILVFVGVFIKTNHGILAHVARDHSLHR